MLHMWNSSPKDKRSLLVRSALLLLEEEKKETFSSTLFRVSTYLFGGYVGAYVLINVLDRILNGPQGLLTSSLLP